MKKPAIFISVVVRALGEKQGKVSTSSGGFLSAHPGGGGGGGGGGRGYLDTTMPVCVCQKVKDMGPFSASRE